MNDDGSRAAEALAADLGYAAPVVGSVAAVALSVLVGPSAGVGAGLPTRRRALGHLDRLEGLERVEGLEGRRRLEGLEGRQLVGEGVVVGGGGRGGAGRWRRRADREERRVAETGAYLVPNEQSAHLALGGHRVVAAEFPVDRGVRRAGVRAGGPAEGWAPRLLQRDGLRPIEQSSGQREHEGEEG